ncbi:MAG: hypothetical protein ABIQ90_00120 [Polaromonas sp.]
MNETAAEIEKQQLQMLYGLMKFVIHLIPASIKIADPAVQAITKQPIFKKFRQILKVIHSIDSDEDLKRFALHRDAIEEVWTTSMHSMDMSLQDNLMVQNLVDQILHHPREMKSALISDTAGKLDPEILAPILDMFSLLDSDAVDRKKLIYWQKNSGNVLGLARYQGRKAGASDMGKDAVEKRMAQEPTNALKEKIKEHWIEALKVKGSDDGMKTHFVRRMQKLAKTDVKGITVSNEQITAWTLMWGGKLQKIDRPNKSQ